MKIFDDILNNIEANAFEKAYFAQNSISELEVINDIGEKIAISFLKEFGKHCPEKCVSVLVAIGTGHNAADALAFLRELAKSKFLNIDLLTREDAKFKENTQKILTELQTCTTTKILTELSDVKAHYDIVVEGIAGMNYRPPLRADVAEKIDLLNKTEAQVKVAIDLPIGLSDSGIDETVFNADVIYATAIAKQCLFYLQNRKMLGRIRYIDAGFFDNKQNQTSRLITRPDALRQLDKLRKSFSDKRSYGKVLIVSGSEKYAGAALLNAKTAIRSGVGFVYACTPEAYKPAFCASEPSVIWQACAVDESGALALENFSQLNAIARNVDVILIGSGLTDSRESTVLACELLKNNPDTCVILDADAISQTILNSLKQRRAPTILTPHEGEFLRLAKDISNEALLKAAQDFSCVVVLKSNITRISDGNSIAYSPRGSPTLARAGSGDILCALIAGLLANKTLLENIGESSLTKKSAQKLCAIATQWLGIAAEYASAELGEIALASSDIIKFLPKAML